MECGPVAGGVCETNGYCSFPDTSCSSGQRYGTYAPATISGMCVLDPDTDGSTSAEASTGGSNTTSVDTSSGDPLPTSAEGSSSSDGVVSTSTTESSSGSTSSGESTDGSTTTGNPLDIVEIGPELALCTDPVSNDAALCEASTGLMGLSVDLLNDGVMQAPTTAFLAFEVPPLPAGATLVSASLVLHTTTDPGSESMDQTGEVWLTESFTADTLALGQPILLGDGPVAADLGGVGTSEPVEWALPVDEITAGPLHLAVVPTSSLGVDYWNAEGDVPPRLVLALQRGG